MTKQRNKFLGDAEIPKSVEDFLSESGGITMKLLLMYVEELETQNKYLHEENLELRKQLTEYDERMDRIETVIERLKGLRVLKPLTPDEQAAKDAAKAERLKERPWKNPRGSGANKGAGKSKGWTREPRKKS